MDDLTTRQLEEINKIFLTFTTKKGAYGGYGEGVTPRFAEGLLEIISSSYSSSQKFALELYRTKILPEKILVPKERISPEVVYVLTEKGIEELLGVSVFISSMYDIELRKAYMAVRDVSEQIDGFFSRIDKLKGENINYDTIESTFMSICEGYLRTRLFEDESYLFELEKLLNISLGKKTFEDPLVKASYAPVALLELDYAVEKPFACKNNHRYELKSLTSEDCPKCGAPLLKNLPPSVNYTNIRGIKNPNSKIIFPFTAIPHLVFDHVKTTWKLHNIFIEEKTWSGRFIDLLLLPKEVIYRSIRKTFEKEDEQFLTIIWEPFFFDNKHLRGKTFVIVFETSEEGLGLRKWYYEFSRLKEKIFEVYAEKLSMNLDNEVNIQIGSVNEETGLIQIDYDLFEVISW